jgi:Ser/Thr protein kinase RdoA (MazF antagonist)
MPEESFGAYGAEVARAFDLGSAAGPMRRAARGVQGSVWRLDTDAGVFAVKVPNRGFEARRDGVDAAFVEALPAGSDLVCPQPVRSRAGDLVVRIAERDVRILTWVDMAEADVRLDPAAVGRMLAILHTTSIAMPTEAVDPWYWAAVGEPAWTSYAERLEAAGAPFATTFHAAIPDLIALEALLVQPEPVRLCHCDLWADNVRATPDHRLAVIDWDNCGPADPTQELGVLLYEFGYPDVERCRALVGAYQAAGGPGRMREASDFTMLVAQFGHFWELAATGWLDPESSSEDLHRAQARADELLDRPLSVSTLERLLAALG